MSRSGCTDIINIDTPLATVCTSFTHNDETKLNELKTKKVKVNLDTLLDDLDRIHKDFKLIDDVVYSLGLDSIEVYYDEVVTGKYDFELLCDFLGVPYIEMYNNEDKKTSPVSLKDSIENYEEVLNFLFPIYPHFFIEEF